MNGFPLVNNALNLEFESKKSSLNNLDKLYTAAKQNAIDGKKSKRSAILVPIIIKILEAIAILMK